MQNQHLGFVFSKPRGRTWGRRIAAASLLSGIVLSAEVTGLGRPGLSQSAWSLSHL
jgi:hypothetical protein